MFRVSQNGETIGDADTLEGAREIVQAREPGCFEVDELYVELSGSVAPPRRWGRMFRNPYDLARDEPLRRPDSSG
jgi:hypothetical protein